MITEKEILDRLLPYLKKAQSPEVEGLIDLPEFALEDEIGKTTSQIIGIKNPLLHPGEKYYNPVYLKVRVFSDDSYQLLMDIAHSHDFTIHHFFLVEQDKIRYNPGLLQDKDRLKHSK